jgi:transposase-like protein
MSKRLTTEEKEEIRVLYRSGEWSMDKLAKKFGCGKSTIKRTIDAPKIKIAPPPKEEPPPEPSSRVMPFTYDPIQFRIQKFQEISLSIDNMEQRGTNPAQLHKLQIDLHERMRKNCS